MAGEMTFGPLVIHRVCGPGRTRRDHWEVKHAQSGILCAWPTTQRDYAMSLARMLVGARLDWQFTSHSTMPSLTYKTGCRLTELWRIKNGLMLEGERYVKQPARTPRRKA